MGRVGERIMGADGKWLMGHVLPRELLQGIGKYLHRVAPEREDELIASIENRAEELIEANEDMAIDKPAEGMLGISAVILAAFETLRPEFDGDERRTILFLQHIFGTVLRRTFEVTFELVTSRENPLDDYEKAVRKERPIYGSYFDMPLERLDSDTFDPATSDLRAERTTLLSLGDDACRFRVLTAVLIRVDPAADSRRGRTSPPRLLA